LYTPIVRMDFARSLLAEGRLAEAAALMQDVVAVYREHYAGSALLGTAVRIQAAAAAALGNHAQARSLLAEAESLWRHGAGGAMQPWRFNRMMFDTARLELAAGVPDAACRALDRVAPWPASESPSPHPDDVERDILSAAAALLQGDIDAALRKAQAAVDAVCVVSARGRQPGLEANAAQAQGLALLAAGQPAAGLAPIERALALRVEFDDPVSPWLAQAEAVHGHCLLLLGDRAAAREAAARAQCIVGAYPWLSGEFTQPLVDLQHALQE
jgi:tetratricopeptide (TPR) repeat protein